MAGVPTYMQGDSIVIIRTMNGYALAAGKSDPIETCVAFDTWEDCAYYLATNFAATPA